MAGKPAGWTILFYNDARGNSPVLEYLNELPDRERARVRNHLRLLQEFGTKLGMPHVRSLTEHKPLWELRSGAIRLFYFAHTGRRFIVLHGFRKKGRKTPQRHIVAAERFMADFLGEEK